MDIRTQRIVSELMNHPESTINDMMLQNGLSKRQVEYSLTKLNQLFTQYNVPQAYFSKRSGLVLSAEQFNVIAEEQRKERKLVASLDAQCRPILIMIFIASSAEFVALQHIMELLSISKNTAIQDLKKAEVLSLDYNITISYDRTIGYHLVGDEWKKRSLIIKCISIFTDWTGYEQIYNYLLGKLGMDAHFNAFLVASLESIHQNQIRMIEKRLHEILLFIYILWQIPECKMGLLVAYEGQLQNVDSECLHVATVLAKRHKHAISENEVRYLAVLLQSIKIESQLSFESPLDKILKRIVEDMVDRFERISCNIIHNKHCITENLFLHLKPVYYRLRYDIPIVNPLLSQMKDEYHEFFEIVRILLKPLEEFMEKKIPEDEIGYITMHFGLITTNEVNIRDIARKSGLILCPNGIGTSALVEKQLNELFPEINFIRASSISELENIERFDVVFSTTEMQNSYASKIPVFIVPVLLSNTRKYHLINQVYERVFGIERKDVDFTLLIDLIEQYADIRDVEGLKHALKNKMVSFSGIKEIHNKGEDCKVLRDLLTKETVQFVRSVDNWERAIELAMRPLLNNGSIEQRYIDAIIGTVRKIGPYIVIAPMVCIPHASVDQGVHKLGMTFLKLEQPVKVLDQEDKQAMLFFGLAATDNHSHLKSLSQLSKMLMDEVILDRLMTLQEPDDFLDIVEKFSSQNEY